MDNNPGQALLEKIARMIHYNATDEEITLVCDVELEELNRIKLMPEFVKLQASLSYNQFDNIQTMNEAWDKVEQIGLKTVLEQLAWTKDPEFALKAAAVANKSNRRGLKTNQTITPQNAGARAVIHLNTTYINQINNQNNLITEQTHNAELFEGKKTQNFMSPQDAERLLMPDHVEGESLEISFARDKFTMDE